MACSLQPAAPDFPLGRSSIPAPGLPFSHPVFNFPRHEILLLSTLSMKDVTIDAMPHVNREGRISGTICNIRMTFFLPCHLTSQTRNSDPSTSDNGFDEPKFGGTHSKR